MNNTVTREPLFKKLKPSGSEHIESKKMAAILHTSNLNNKL